MCGVILELTSSIPVGVTGRAAAIARPRLCPCRVMHQVEALPEMIVMAQTTPHPVPCVELSELTSSSPIGRTFNNMGEGIFKLVGCSGVLVPVGSKVRAKTQPKP